MKTKVIALGGRAGLGRTVLAVGMVLFVVCATGLGQMIIPLPPPRPQPTFRAPEIREHKVELNLAEGNASTSVELVLFNPNPVQYEGDFLFEVPGDAAISHLSMTVNGKEVRAELLGSEEAQRIYEDTVRRMRDPALLQIAGDRLIRARVFPIPPGGEQKIKLGYSHQLVPDNGLYTCRYPMSSRSSGSSPWQKFSIAVHIKTDSPIKSIVCPTYKVDIANDGEYRATVGFETDKVTPENDFLLYIDVERKDIGLKILSYREKGRDGYFMAMIGPGCDEGDAKEVQEKSVVFAIDTSGSMSSDEKTDQVRKALKYCLKHLNGDDTFDIVDFSTTARMFRDKLVPANEENIAAALKYADALEAAGGTAIAEALKRCVALRREGTAPFIVIFLTDGMPTIGTADTEQLLDIVKSAKLKTAQFFTFGVGHDVNTHLLDRLAQENHGATTYVQPGEDLENKITALHRKISFPALTNVKLDFKGIRVYDIYPQTIPDLFRGTTTTIVGRYEGNGDKVIELAGALRGKPKVITNEGSFARDDTRSDWLPRAWATRKIGYLLDQMRLHGGNGELKDEVVRLSKEFGIMTPYTSFLVYEDESRRFATPGPRPLPMPVMPQDTQAWRMMTESAPAMDATSGEKAVRSSVGVARLQEGYAGAAGDEGVVAESLRTVMKHVGSKTYYLVGDRWTASTWDGKGQTIKVKYLSDEYFRLAREHKELSGAFALGAKVIAECEGKFYEVAE